MQFPPEKIVNVQLSHIIDPTVLRALGYIHNEDDVTGYFINGQSLVPLMIKFKTQAAPATQQPPKKLEVEVIHHNGSKL